MAPQMPDLTKVPMVRPPPGKQSNFSNPEDIAWVYYVVGGVGTTLATLFVLIRLYVRIAVSNTAWWDDAATVIALLSQAAYTGVIMRLSKIAIGRNAWNVPAIVAKEFRPLAKASSVLTAPAIFFTKLALLLLYLKLFAQNRLVRILIWIGIVGCGIYYTVAMFMYIFIADQAILFKLTESVAAIGVVTDVYIICLPLFAVSSLHMNRRRKWALAAVFMTGLLAVAMSIVGCVFRFNFTEDSRKDLTRALLRVYLVNTVEVDVGIICACLPLLAKLFKPGTKEAWWLTTLRSIAGHLLATLRSGSRGSGSHSDGSGGSRFSRRSNRSNRPKRQDYVKNIDALGSDTVELDQRHQEMRDVEAEAEGSGKDIKQTTTIQQEYSQRT